MLEAYHVFLLRFHFLSSSLKVHLDRFAPSETRSNLFLFT